MFFFWCRSIHLGSFFNFNDSKLIDSPSADDLFEPFKKVRFYVRNPDEGGWRVSCLKSEAMAAMVPEKTMRYLTVHQVPSCKRTADRPLQSRKTSWIWYFSILRLLGQTFDTCFFLIWEGYIEWLRLMFFLRQSRHSHNNILYNGPQKHVRFGLLRDSCCWQIYFSFTCDSVHNTHRQRSHANFETTTQLMASPQEPPWEFCCFDLLQEIYHIPVFYIGSWRI